MFSCKRKKVQSSGIPGHTKPCPQCCEPIIRQAKFCKHCKADLSWRRHVAFSSTSLALLTALVAVTGTLGPAIKQMLVPSQAQPDALLIGSDDKSVTFLLTNSGAKATTVNRAIIVKVTNSGKRLAIDFRADPVAIIPPGGTISQKFFNEYVLMTEIGEKALPVPDAIKCNYNVSGQHLNGEIFNIEKVQQLCGDALLSFHLESERHSRTGPQTRGTHETAARRAAPLP